MRGKMGLGRVTFTVSAAAHWSRGRKAKMPARSCNSTAIQGMKGRWDNGVASFTYGELIGLTREERRAGCLEILERIQVCGAAD